MNLIRYLLRSARGIVCYTSVTALLSGACNAGLIALVNIALTNPDAPRPALAWSFVGLGLGKLLTTFLSQLALARYSQRATAELRRELIRKILAVPLRRLEKIGTPRIMVALTEDVMNISQALLAIPGFAGNVAILFGGAVYLGWLSWKLLLTLCGILALGTLIYRVLIVRGFEYLNLAREEEDRLFGYFRALTEGIKELKLNRARRASFVFKDVQSVTEACQNHNVSAEIRFILAQGWNHLLFYALIGLILFLLPGFQRITPQALTGYVVTTLYLMGPLAGVLGSLSVFTRANVALSKIERLGVSMSTQVTEEFPLIFKPNKVEFASLELAEVTHSYHHEKDDNHFILGPVNLVFQPGELIFVVGGNGSGKSTLAKIITGLYPPETGEILLNGLPVTDRNRDDFRQIFSAIFADFHLFENLAGAACGDLDARAQFFLRQLHLDHKVKIANGELSTTALSQGQRKRLTLLMAYLEDRPFYLFDEWASDQDPQFKEIFYHQLLPELKSRGKTVVVITHDDRYFPVADRIIKLDYGKIVYEKPAGVPRFQEPVFQLT